MVKAWIYNKLSQEYPGSSFDVLSTPDPAMGDYSTNIVFSLSKQNRKNPSGVAAEVIEKLVHDKEAEKLFEKIKFSEPGFINFFLKKDFLVERLSYILREGEKYGSSGGPRGKKINLEFVSANPTGPMTVHNARAASYGDALGNVLSRNGYEVAKEYYINDVGVQVNLLGESVAKRYLQLKGEVIDFPENLYQGDYIKDIAREIKASNGAPPADDFDVLSRFCQTYAVKKLVQSAKDSMLKLGVRFDVWFSERQLHDSGAVKSILSILESSGYVYERDGAKWLKVSEIIKGEGDAVVVKSDGATSYLLNDIAYTDDKFKRGFDTAVNIWGADHHGDVARLKAGAQALGYEKGKLEILLHQLVMIKTKDELQKMSKRQGKFFLLDDLIKETGKDAVRFFFLLKDLNTHMEFDIELAKEQSKRNPVYYVQYATARLASIFQKASMESRPQDTGDLLEPLKEKEELYLMRLLVKFPELIEDISRTYQVHHLGQFALELAWAFHRFYEKCRIIGENKKIETARLHLAHAVHVVLKNTLDILGIDAPDKM